MRHNNRELDGMTAATFEALLASDFVVPRSDIKERQGSCPTADEPIFPNQGVELLRLSQSGLVRMLRAGWLTKPGKLMSGRVAWRRDEIMAQLPDRPNSYE